MKKKYLLIFLTIISIRAFSQFNPPNPTVSSSNIGKQSLEISNDLYNGRINVSFPILKYSFEGIDFPISISYSGNNGLMPDQLPSWVGAGWNLDAGGFITRTVRGKPDETRDFETLIYTPYDYGNPSTPVDEKKTTLNATDYSYFANYNKLTNTNWSEAANDFTQSNMPVSIGGDPYYLRTFYNTHPHYDLVPDEFSFSMGGISGKFYLNHLNKWVVQSSDGKDYKVQVVSGELITANYTTQTGFKIFEKVPRLIKYIVLTSTEGVKYYFGNENENAPFSEQYFDFSHSSTLRFTPDRFVDNYTSGNTSPTLIDIVPHTWHLTKVVNTKTQSVISFNYKESFQFYTTKQAYGTGGLYGRFIYKNHQIQINQNSIFPEPLSAISRVLTRTWSLTSIDFPNGAKIQFESSPSEQLSTNEPINASDSWFLTYPDIKNYIGFGGNNTLLQLNKIILSFNDIVKKEILFNYKLSNSQRLQLEYFGVNYNGRIVNKYTFLYNKNADLPPYGSGKNDHWGFFNNKDFFESIPPDLGQDRYSYAAISDYANYREPDIAYSIAEILTKIVYPEGGSIEFKYESNEYSKKKKSPSDFSIENINSNVIGGGVRIKEVKYYSGEGTLENSKTFKYEIPGTSGLSSGVLGVLPQRYLFGSGELFAFQASGYDGIYYSGNAVTYTYVEEIQMNNGKKLYQYTNSDNGYADIEPLLTNVPTESSFQFDYAYQNNSFKRGKLMSEKVFSETGDLIKETKYHYEHENNESNKNEVRSLYLDGLSPSNFASVSEKIYPDNVISREEINSTPNGNISSKSEITYDIYGNIKTSKTFDSKGRVIKKKYTYAQDYSSVGSDDISLGIKYLNDLAIKNAPIEILTFYENADGMNSNVISALLNTYKKESAYVDKTYSLQISTPISASSFTEATISAGNFVMDSHYGNKPEKLFNRYDSKGNILEIVTKKGISQSYIWSYNGIYPVTVVNNSGSYDIAYTSFEIHDTNGGWWFGENGIDPTQAITGKQCLKLDNILLTSFVPVPGKSYILSYWYKEGADVGVGGFINKSNFKTGQTINGWTYCQMEISGKEIDIMGSGYIDELRLYPTGAQMTTYTYEPLIGMTSQCDANNKITRYEYDALGRLSFVRDENNNILKKICYNYAGQAETCDCTSYDPNWQNTTTPLRCRINNNKNTGEQEQEQKDTNPCSVSYNQTQWIITGINLTACPLPPNCNSSNCSGVDQECVNDICETGIKVYTGSHREGPYQYCEYHYEFSDGSWSADYSEEVPPGTDCTVLHP